LHIHRRNLEVCQRQPVARRAHKLLPGQQVRIRREQCPQKILGVARLLAHLHKLLPAQQKILPPSVLTDFDLKLAEQVGEITEAFGRAWLSSSFDVGIQMTVQWLK
jgi:hypothetical protein